MNENLSYIEKLKTQIDNIGIIIDEMLDNSSIYYHDPNANSNVLILGASVYHWGEKDEKNQIKIREEYNSFYSNFELLLHKATPNILRKIKNANGRIINLIEQKRAPSSIEGGKKSYQTQTKVFKDFLELLNKEDNRIVILPDTNSLIQYPDPADYKIIADSEKFDFVILPTVLSELDKLKISHRSEDFRKKVKSVIKRLKGYRKQGSVLKGVKVNKTITVKMIATEPDFDKTLNWLDPNNNDDRIIANALEFQVNKPSDNVIFVSADINFQNKAELANLTIYDTDELG
ncbi:PIN domain-containing protein [Tamlana sp. 2201CG12-4]|uniref:PIN domain-containing protein n=1 Tax=Tamlana sp. 2201CG12-4 TaxID=3112582 RepID=UPI002DBBFCF4|nr:PIN domain-containing protein [Tamlana sp. 2201CG12-4]MEC3906069.1 PIN domain-containing protein [Tamlana sp. 2201CG12-4]